MRKPIPLLLMLIACLFMGSCTYKEADQYVIVIDAGSSGSRIYIYRIIDGIYDDLPFVSAAAEALKVEPGISQMDESPVQVVSGIGQLIKYARGYIPEDRWARTPLHLMATAGMRLESPNQQKKTMEILSTLLQQSPFDFQEAIILSGKYEGLYAWVAVNYLDDAFDPQTDRESMLEMGGASTQYAHLTDSKQTDRIIREYRGQSYDIFSKSYLLMGQDQAYGHTNTANCFPKGMELENGPLGMGNFEACANDIVKEYNQLCALGSDPECLFNQNLSIKTDDVYLAISAFYYTLDFLGFKDEFTLQDLKQQGSAYCELGWENIKQDPRYKDIPEKYLKTYCFYSSYFWSLLNQGYHMNENLKIRFTNDMQNSEPSWTWGAAVDLALGHKPEAYVNPQ